MLLDVSCIAEVVDTHGSANLIHGLGCKGTGFLTALLQDVEHLRNILLVFMTAGTDRSKHLVEHTVEEFLTGSVTDASLHILSLQFVEILELRPELSEVLGCRECLEISEHGIALQMSWFFHTVFSSSLR